MARRRLTPAQPGYLTAPFAPETTSAQPPAPPPIARVSGQSAEAAALRDLAEGIEAARRGGQIIVDVPLGHVAPEHLLRDRIALDREALNALKASIQKHGQRMPADIVPLETATPNEEETPYRFGLVSGWRRFRALSELYDETHEVRFSTIRALIRPEQDTAQAYVAMVEENEVRVGLSYYERARLVADTTKRGVFEDQRVALQTLFASASRAKRSKISSFIEIYEHLGNSLYFPSAIPERLGLALVEQLRQGHGARIRAALEQTTLQSPTQELAFLNELIRPVAQEKAAPTSESLCPGLTAKVARRKHNITLTLSGAEVDDALFKEVMAALRQLGTSRSKE